MFPSIHPHTRQIRTSWWCLVFVVLGLYTAGCGLSAAEIRERRSVQEDPRQRDADLIWKAMKQVTEEKTWEVELERPQEMLLSTTWMPCMECGQSDIVQRVRFMILRVPGGLGINVSVKYARSTGSPLNAPNEESLEVLSGEPWASRSAALEQSLSKRVYGLWQASR